jgi:hypothetical protein
MVDDLGHETLHGNYKEGSLGEDGLGFSNVLDKSGSDSIGIPWGGLNNANYYYKTSSASLNGPFVIGERGPSQKMLGKPRRELDVGVISSMHVSPGQTSRPTNNHSRGERKIEPKEKTPISPMDVSTYNTPYHRKAFLKYGVTPGSLFSEDTLGNLSGMVFSEDSAYTDATFMETIDRINDEVENIEKLIKNQRQRQELLRERARSRKVAKETLAQRYPPSRVEDHDSMPKFFVGASLESSNRNGDTFPELVSKFSPQKIGTSTTTAWEEKEMASDLSSSTSHAKQLSHYSGGVPFETSIDRINRTDISLASISVQDISGVYQFKSLDLESEPAPASMAKFQWSLENHSKAVSKGK